MMQLCHSLESLGCFHCDPWMLVCDLPYVCGQLNTWWTIFIYQQEGSVGIKDKHNFYVQQTAQQKCNKGYEEMHVAERSEGATLPDSWHLQEWLQVHLIVWDMAFLWWETITTVVSLNTNTLLHSFDQQSKSSCWQSCTRYGGSRRGSLLLAFWLLDTAGFLHIDLFLPSFQAAALYGQTSHPQPLLPGSLPFPSVLAFCLPCSGFTFYCTALHWVP